MTDPIPGDTMRHLAKQDETDDKYERAHASLSADLRSAIRNTIATMGQSLQEPMSGVPDPGRDPICLIPRDVIIDDFYGEHGNTTFAVLMGVLVRAAKDGDTIAAGWIEARCQSYADTYASDVAADMDD